MRKKNISTYLLILFSLPHGAFGAAPDARIIEITEDNFSKNGTIYTLSFLDAIKDVVRSKNGATGRSTFSPLKSFTHINLKKHIGLNTSENNASKWRWLYKGMNPFGGYDSRLVKEGEYALYDNDYDYRMQSILGRSLGGALAFLGAVTGLYVAYHGLGGITSALPGLLKIGGSLFGYDLVRNGWSRYKELGELSAKTKRDYATVSGLLKSNDKKLLVMPKSLFEESILPGMSSSDRDNLEIKYSTALRNENKLSDNKETLVVLRKATNPIKNKVNP